MGAEVIMQSSPSVPTKPVWQNAIILIYATLALVIDHYRTVFGKEEWDSHIFYLIIPLALLLLFRVSPATYGFRWGDWRRGLLLTVGGCALVAPLLWWAAQIPSVNAYYGDIWRQSGWGGVVSWAVQDLFGWEFFFRGFLLFTFAEIAGPWAILLQAILFTFGHLSKPELEVLSCIAGGSAFGWVAWKTQSFLYPFLIHLFVELFVVWAATMIM